MSWDLLNAIEDFTKSLDLNSKLRFMSVKEWIKCFQLLGKYEMAQRDIAHLEILEEESVQFVNSKLIEDE